MGIDRREFLKITGLATLLGIGGTAMAGAVKKGAEQGPYVDDPRGLKAKRWGMVVDMSKFKSEEDIKRVVKACHSIHNVPDMPDQRQEIKWIWPEAYEHAFPGQEDKFMGAEFRHMPFMVLCNHCENPPCVRVCPTQATFKRKSDGIVMMDMHRCIGCRFCMAGCPYGARSFNFIDPRPFIKETHPEFPTRMKGVVEKCTLCYERIAKGQQPACVEASNGGLIFGDLQDPDSPVRKALADNFTVRRKPDLGTGPSVYYIVGGKHA
jgi:molybdopterin-containing oxidoreductase family iron-sulfur binding subunit